MSRRYISLFPVLLSCHTTSVRLAIDSIWGNCESPVLLLRLIGVPKPISSIRTVAKIYFVISRTIILPYNKRPVTIDSIWGNCESPVLLLRFFLLLDSLLPSSEWMYISLFPVLLSCHTTSVRLLSTQSGGMAWTVQGS